MSGGQPHTLIIRGKLKKNEGKLGKSGKKLEMCRTEVIKEKFKEN